jgi:hypothetical protein
VTFEVKPISELADILWFEVQSFPYSLHPVAKGSAASLQVTVFVEDLSQIEQDIMTATRGSEHQKIPSESCWQVG